MSWLEKNGWIAWALGLSPELALATCLVCPRHTMTGRQVPPEKRKGGQGDKAVTRYQFHTKRVDEVLLAAPLRAGRGQPKTPNVCQSCQSLVTVTVTASASLGLSALRAPWSIPVRLVSKQCTFVPMYFRALLNPSDTDLKANSTRTRTRTGTRPRKGTYLGTPRRAVRCGALRWCVVRKAELGPVDLATAGSDPTHGPTAPRNGTA